MAHDPLSDFTLEQFEHQGVNKDVYRQGDGPAVIVMSEVPGITPEVANFARRVVEAGMSVWMPDLFGDPGRPPSVPYILQTMMKNCVSKEFSSFALGSTSPVTGWLRALAAHAHEVSGGAGVGAVGMCWTGGFALGMMVDERLVAPVLSQPSLPIALRPGAKSDLGISEADLKIVKERAEGGQCVMGLRFTGDSLVPSERFERLADELGDRFIAIEIDSSKGNEGGNRRLAHSVLTEDLIDEPGHATREALDRVIEFLSGQLGVA